MRSGKKRKDPSDVVNDVGEGDMIKAKHAPSAEDNYTQEKNDSDDKDFAPRHILLFKKPCQSYHQNAGGAGRFSFVKKEPSGWAGKSSCADYTSRSRRFE